MCLVGLGSTTHYRLVFVAPAAVTGATALAALRARRTGTVAARLKVVAIVGLWPTFGRIPSVPAIVVAVPALGGVRTDGAGRVSFSDVVRSHSRRFRHWSRGIHALGNTHGDDRASRQKILPKNPRPPSNAPVIRHGFFGHWVTGPRGPLCRRSDFWRCGRLTPAAAQANRLYRLNVPF